MKTLIYILASGRSGSTLLDKLVSAHPDINGYGEIGRLPNRLSNSPQYCGCKKPIEDCDLWRPVLLEILKEDQWSFEKWNNYLLNYLFEKNDIIVESSGNLERLKNLESKFSDSFDLKIIYLRRNPLGVVYSMSKKKRRADGKKFSLLQATLSWAVRNFQMKKYIAKSKNSTIQITYDDLCEKPNKVMSEVYSFLGVEKKNINDLNWNDKTHHTYAGNLGLRKSRSNEIRKDEKWKEGFNYLEKLLIRYTVKLFRFNY